MLSVRNYGTSMVFGKATHKPTRFTIVRAVRNYFCKSELLSYSKQLSEVQLNLLYTLYMLNVVNNTTGWFIPTSCVIDYLQHI